MGGDLVDRVLWGGARRGLDNIVLASPNFGLVEEPQQVLVRRKPAWVLTVKPHSKMVSFLLICTPQGTEWTVVDRGDNVGPARDP